MDKNLSRKERRILERSSHSDPKPRAKGSLVLGGVLVAVAGGMMALFVAGGGGSNDQARAPQGDIVSQSGVHWHPELEIYVKEQKVDIPPNMGLGASHKPVHTHDDVPKLHWEYEKGPVTKEDAKLGNFFKTWNKPFSANELLDNKGKVKMTVNGQENTEYENYVVKDGDKIVLRYE